MGRRKNNPDLVDELIEGRWTMDQEEFEQKYYFLSSSDMSKMAESIYGMQNEDPDCLFEDDDDDSEGISVYDAADIWLSSGMDEDNTFGYTEDELRNALR